MRRREGRGTPVTRAESSEHVGVEHEHLQPRGFGCRRHLASNSLLESGQLLREGPAPFEIVLPEPDYDPASFHQFS
jgi:hypothetical protein